jgi:hypothetical protein
VGRQAQSDRPRWAPGDVSPRFLPKLFLFYLLLRSENFKRSLNKEIEVPRVFLFGLFIWPNWELENPSHQAYFCIHVAAMASPRSIELKQGAKEPSMEEVKRCELKLPVEIKRTARIRCRGRVPTYHFSQLRRRGGGAYSRSKVGAHSRHETEGLQGGVA